MVWGLQCYGTLQNYSWTAGDFLASRLFLSSSNEKTYYLAERVSGKYERNFMFDENIDTEKISAELKNGVLTINLPKSEDAKPKIITIA